MLLFAQMNHGPDLNVPSKADFVSVSVCQFLIFSLFFFKGIFGNIFESYYMAGRSVVFIKFTHFVVKL